MNHEEGGSRSRCYTWNEILSLRDSYFRVGARRRGGFCRMQTRLARCEPLEGHLTHSAVVSPQDKPLSRAEWVPARSFRSRASSGARTVVLAPELALERK